MEHRAPRRTPDNPAGPPGCSAARFRRAGRARPRSVGLLLTALAPLAGCAPVDVLNAITPARGYDRSAAIAYGDDPRQALDVYRPKGAAGLRPVVVFFYGGNWREGDRADYRFVGGAMTERGYVCVIPDYRLYPQVSFPGFVEDAASAVRWARDHAAEYGGDPDRLFVMGHSAGGAPGGDGRGRAAVPERGRDGAVGRPGGGAALGAVRLPAAGRPETRRRLRRSQRRPRRRADHVRRRRPAADPAGERGEGHDRRPGQLRRDGPPHSRGRRRRAARRLPEARARRRRARARQAIPMARAGARRRDDVLRRTRGRLARHAVGRGRLDPGGRGAK